MILPRLYDKRTMEEIRKKRLYTQGSPRFKLTITDLVAGAQKLYGFESDSTSRKYLPFNWMRLVNDSGVDLEISIGQENAEIIKNNSIFTQEGNFHSFILKNVDATATATGTKVVTHIQRKPTGA